jgi:hypothetical protein
MAKRPRIKGRGADIYLGIEGDEQAGISRQIVAKRRPKRSPRAKKVDGKENDGELCRLVPGLARARDAVAWYLAANQKLTNQLLEQQAKNISWAERTPLAPIFDAQIAIARRMLEQSTSVAKSLWQIN